MFIKVGRYEFRIESLKEVTLKDAIKLFDHIDKRIVEQAYRKVKPKRPSKKKIQKD
jgi:hypothetical protein